MLIPKRDVDILESLGLSKLQAKIYLATIKLEEATAQKISESIQVARQQVYPVAKELQEIGLIETILDKSLKLNHVSMADAVSILLRRKYQERSEAEKRALELTKRYKPKNKKNTLDVKKAEFILIPEKNALSTKLQRSIDCVQESIDLWTPKKTCMQALFRLSSNFLKALEKGARIRCVIDEHLVVNQIPADVKKIMEHPLFELKVVSGICMETFGIYDKQIVIFGCQPRQDYARTKALWTNNDPLVRIVQYYFDSMWKEAMPPNNDFKTQS